MDDGIQYALNQFKEDTANHTMEILLDNGNYRHLRFSNRGSLLSRFDLITWPGYLLICEDMGTYVFHRTGDMLESFRSKNSELIINPRYWASRCTAKSMEGIERYSPEKFENSIEDWMEEHGFTHEAKESARDKVISLAEYDEDAARVAAMDFHHSGFGFEGFEEVNVKVWSLHYLWNLHAIVWGIQQYDSQRKENPNGQ